MGVSLEASTSDQPIEEVIPNGDILDPPSKFLESDWYQDIIHYLQHLQCPDCMDRSQARSLRLKAMKYCILDGQLYWKDPGGILLTCITEEKTGEVIEEFHRGICGGNKAWKATAYKILRAGYYWPTLFQEMNSRVRACPKCQRFVGRQKLKSLPLKPVRIESPFQQWGLDFIGEIHPNSSGQHRWILTATDYFTKWVEAIPTKKIVMDNAQAFRSGKIFSFSQDYGIELVDSIAYYP